MTTIAADRNCMAADTKVTHGDHTFYAKKISIEGDSIVGCAGRTHQIARFMAWFRAGRPADAPSLYDGDNDDNTIEVLVLNREDGLVLYTDCCEGDAVKDRNYAIGAGSQAALAAMRVYKASPRSAVLAASKVSNTTGGNIDVIWLSDIKRKRKA